MVEKATADSLFSYIRPLSSSLWVCIRGNLVFITISAAHPKQQLFWSEGRRGKKNYNAQHKWRSGIENTKT
jgi:hypothetical protein